VTDAGAGEGYTAREVAALLGLSAKLVRAFVRSGFLSPRRGRRGEYRFTMQDVVLLRTAKGLSERVPARKVTRALRGLQDRLPEDRPLSAVRLAAMGEEVVVQSGASAWRAESGQGLIPFEAPEPRAPLPLHRRVEDEARAFGAALSAEGWYDLGCELEPDDPDRACEAYRRALDLDPAHVDARVNLGRLLHEAGDPGAAEAQYRLALRLSPEDATAAFNLGVALEDLGRPKDAIAAYRRALRADPDHGDAHYNLARLLEADGRRSEAFVHLKAYRRLTRLS
jgi:tetratricopeptide (TPR) repeat protein